MVQRSRAFVRKSQAQEGGRQAIFPTREDPKVVPYSVKKVYGNLLDLIEPGRGRNTASRVYSRRRPPLPERGLTMTTEERIENLEKGLASARRLSRGLLAAVGLTMQSPTDRPGADHRGTSSR